MPGELNLRFKIHAPNQIEVRKVVDRWQEMKRELGEEITPRGIKDELVLLIARMYSTEIQCD